MRRVILIRHAETEWNAQLRHIGLTDLELTEKGRKQAQSLAKALTLEEIPLTAIYSSSLRRSRQTAEAIAKNHKLELKLVPALNEIDFGEWEGRTWEDIKRDYPDLYKKWLRGDKDFGMPGGENWQTFKNRVLNVFQRILKENSEGTVAIIGHGGALKTIICETLNLGSSCFFNFQLSPAAISIFDLDGDKATLTLLNDTCHLETEGAVD